MAFPHAIPMAPTFFQQPFHLLIHTVVHKLSTGLSTGCHEDFHTFPAAFPVGHVQATSTMRGSCPVARRNFRKSSRLMVVVAVFTSG